MTLPRLLSVLVFVNALGGVLSCGGGSPPPPPPPPPCSWTVCRLEWRDDWAPPISTGRCVEQLRRAHHVNNQHQGSGSCPAPQPCNPQDPQYRLLCSCRHAYQCPFHAWSNWEGSVAPGACGRQSRYRDYNEQIRYDTKVGGCTGIKNSCGSRQYDYRDWCNE